MVKSTFRDQLVKDIYLLKQNRYHSDINCPISFAEFLGHVSNETLENYTNVILTTLEKEEPSQDELQMAVDLYSYVVIVLECESSESVKIDCDDKWLLTTFCFLMMEKFQRDKHISDFSGFLKVGKPTYKQTREMSNEMQKYINNLKLYI